MRQSNGPLVMADMPEVIPQAIYHILEVASGIRRFGKGQGSKIFCKLT
jgi:hypothetical protein